MSGFTLVSVFLTLLLSSFPAAFAPLITELQKSIDEAKSQISATGYTDTLERSVKDIKKHLRWLRFVMVVFTFYFVFYLVIIVGYLRIAILLKAVLTSVFPTRYLAIVPGAILGLLVGLHQSRRLSKSAPTPSSTPITIPHVYLASKGRLRPTGH